MQGAAAGTTPSALTPCAYPRAACAGMWSARARIACQRTLRMPHRRRTEACTRSLVATSTTRGLSPILRLSPQSLRLGVGSILQSAALRTACSARSNLRDLSCVPTNNTNNNNNNIIIITIIINILNIIIIIIIIIIMIIIIKTIYNNIFKPESVMPEGLLPRPRWDRSRVATSVCILLSICL